MFGLMFNNNLTKIHNNYDQINTIIKYYLKIKNRTEDNISNDIRNQNVMQY